MKRFLALFMCFCLIPAPGLWAQSPSQRDELRDLKARVARNQALLEALLATTDEKKAAIGADLKSRQEEVSGDLQAIGRFLESKGGDADSLEWLRDCIEQVSGAVGPTQPPVSAPTKEKCGQTRQEFEQRLKEKFNQARDAVKATIEECPSAVDLSDLTDQNWSDPERFWEQVEELGELEDEARECVETVHENYQKLSQSADKTAELFNLATTVCAASGGNPWACGIAYAIAILAALFDLGSGGDGDGGKEEGGGNAGGPEGPDQGAKEGEGRSPAGETGSAYGGASGSIECQENGPFLRCQGPGIPPNTRVPLRITKLQAVGGYLAVAADSTVPLDEADHRALGVLLGSAPSQREVVVCIPGETLSLALPQSPNHFNRAYAGLAYRNKGGGDWFEVWQLYKADGRATNEVALRIGDAQPCMLFQ